jgi:hypothetical protein
MQTYNTPGAHGNLRLALRLNAGFSTLSAIVILAAHTRPSPR